ALFGRTTRIHNSPAPSRGAGMEREERIDTDQNGQISKQEAEDAFDKLFERMDRNKDGVISIDDMPDRTLL
ncbi:hypothetical protein ACC811_37505, partial [Rhizobium ruizarguesonis]